MLELIPTEHFEYDVGDVIRGMNAALRPGGTGNVIQIPGLGSCIPARSARAAIVTAIKALDLQAGARVGVPLYCCPVVFKAVKEAGCVTRFIDVEYSTYCMSTEDFETKRAQLDAVIAVHMFGNPCDMPRLITAAQGIPIIEDCAQSLGSMYNGIMAGGYGTIAAYSFRSGKYLAVGEGGALYSRDAGIHARLSQLISEMPVPGTANECKHIAETYIRAKLRSRPLYGLIGYRIWSIYNKVADYADKSPIVLSQTYKSDLALAVKRLALLDSTIEKQRANADYYSRSLKLDPDMLCQEKPGTFYNRYLYPITFSSPEHRDFMAAYLFSRGIAAIQPYKDIVGIAREHYGYDGGCPVSEQIASRVLVIPSEFGLEMEALQRIAQCVNEGWKTLKNQLDLSQGRGTYARGNG